MVGNQPLDVLIGECLKAKLAFIPNTKLVIINGLNSWMRIETIPCETLLVICSFLSKETVLATMSELLNKRWQTLDLISVMLELQRTVGIMLPPQNPPVRSGVYRMKDDDVKVRDTLSCLPRLQKTE